MVKTGSASEEMVELVIDKFWETVPPIWHITRAFHHTQAMQHFDVTVEQFHILRRILKGRASVSELADDKHISRAAASRAVDALVNRGLIERIPDAEDRRRVHLALSESGQELIDSMFQSSHSWMAEKFGQQKDDDLALIVEAMDKLHQIFCETDCHHGEPIR